MYNRSLMAAQSIKNHAEQYTCFYDEKNAERIIETQNRVEEIRQVLENDEFVFFIGLMEELGLIEKLDFKILEMVCKKLREWKDGGITDQYISVNISAKDFYYMNIYDTFIKLTEKYDIDRKKLRLEITESAVMQDEKNQIGLIDKPRRRFQCLNTSADL